MARAKLEVVETARGADASMVADSSVFFKLIRLVNLTARPFQESVGKQHQLSLIEWRVMVVLSSHPGAAATEVVSYTGLDKMSVSRALASLLKAGRITRTPDALDARRAHVQLSAKGRVLFERISASAVVREAQLFSGISARDLKKFETIVERLTAAIHEHPEA
jgi:DNA-binding MarR family transcriptional regulator